MGVSRLVRVLTGLVLVAGLTGVPSATAAEPIVNTTAPAVEGLPAYREKLTAWPGVWSPAAVAYAYQWLRDGVPLAGATTASYRPALEDVGHAISVTVTATEATGAQAAASSAATTISRAAFAVGKVPAATGVPRFGRTLTAEKPALTPRPTTLRYRWLRDEEPIAGARHRTYRLTADDVGHRVRAVMTARREGYLTQTVTTRARSVLHLVPLRRTFTYHVETRGPINANLAEFRRQAQETFEDPRGWRTAGVAFRPVASGGDFTLVLAVAGAVPGFSSGCSATWSCRVGRYVIINQTRWQTASPAWNARGRSLRDYRHLVVNHETGHWLGHGHRGCAGPGPAPVMMQQSKGTGACSFNPWPLPSERWVHR